MYNVVFYTASVVFVVCIYCTFTYYTHYDSLTIPLSISQWSYTKNILTASVYGIQDSHIHNPHDIYMDIVMVNNDRLLLVRTMTLHFKTIVGDFVRIVHMYPHSHIVWWASKGILFWWSIFSSHEYTTNRHLLLSNVYFPNIMTPLSHSIRNTTQMHPNLYCEPSPCNTPSLVEFQHVNTLVSLGQLEIQNAPDGIWPDIVNIDIVLVPTFSRGIHSLIRKHPLCMFIITYTITSMYILITTVFIINKAYSYIKSVK